MILSVLIRNNTTGETRLYADDDWTPEKVAEGLVGYMYGEGNYACDCNRSLFFARAGGDEGDVDNAVCSDGLFSILSITDEHGNEIYKDDWR